VVCAATVPAKMLAVVPGEYEGKQTDNACRPAFAGSMQSRNVLIPLMRSHVHSML
jgi:hypothetical protein